MRTINKVGGVNGLSYTEFYGNSTDIKPTDDTIPNGSVFYEIDKNMQEYRWDKENSTWRKISLPISGGGGSTTGDYLPLSGGTMSGNIDMDGYQVENVSELSMGETGFVGIIPHETTSDTDSGTTVEISNPKTKKDVKLRGIDTPINDNDAVNKKYADEIKEYGIEHNPVLDSGQEEFKAGQNDLAYVFKNSMILDSGDRFYFADPLSLTDGMPIPFITSAMDENNGYHLLTGTYPKGQDNGYEPVRLEGIATPTTDSMAVNKKYVDDLVRTITENQVTIQRSDNPDMCINLTVDGDEASGVLDLTDKNGNPVVVRGVDTPIQDTDAVNKKFLEDSLKNISGGSTGEYVPTKDLDMKQYKLINTSAVEIFGGINDSEDNSYFIRETSQASINTDTSVPEYVKVITGVHIGDTNQDVILRGIRAGQQKNDAVNYGQLKTLADSFDRCQQDVEVLNEWKATFDEHAVENTVNSIIKHTDQAFELNVTATTKEQWFSYDLAMQKGYIPVSATLVIDDNSSFVGHCSLDITSDGTYNGLIYLKIIGGSSATTCNCKVRLVWIKNPTTTS